jgi:hypothetical protein
VPPRAALNDGGLVFYSGGHGPGAAAQSFKLQLDMHAALATTHTTPCTPRRWWACMPSRRHLPARTRAFVDFLRQALGSEDRDPWLSAAGCKAVLGLPTPHESVEKNHLV